MTATPEPQGASAGVADGAGPAALLAELRASAGSLVEGTHVGSWDDAPSVAALPPARADAVLAAWTGARLHAGAPGLIAATDPDVALLVGDWCFAHALQALAHAGDLEAIGVLATAIATCATALAGPEIASDGGLAQLAATWMGVTEILGAR